MVLADTSWHGRQVSNDSETRQRLSDALQSMRARRGMTYEDVSMASGVPLRSVQGLLGGERDIPGHRLDALCLGMGCSVAQVLALAASADSE